MPARFLIVGLLSVFFVVASALSEFCDLAWWVRGFILVFPLGMALGFFLAADKLLEEERAESARLRRINRDTHNRRVELERQNDGLHKELSEAVEEIGRLKQDLAELSRQRNELKKEITMLRMERATFQLWKRGLIRHMENVVEYAGRKDQPAPPENPPQDT